MLIIVMIGLYDWFLWVVWNNCTIAKNFQPLSFLHKKRDWMEWIRLLLLLPYFLLLDHRILMFGGGGGFYGDMIEKLNGLNFLHHNYTQFFW